MIQLTEDQKDLLRKLVKDADRFWGGYMYPLNAPGLVLIQEGLAEFSTGRMSCLEPTVRGKQYVKENL